MTLWDSKRSLDLPPVPPQCHSQAGKRREGREQQGIHQCNQGPRSIPETDGAQEGRETGRRSTVLGPHFHLTTTGMWGGLQGKKLKQGRVGTCPGSCCNEQQRQDLHTSVSGPGLALLLALSVSMACEEGQAQKEG